MYRGIIPSLVSGEWNMIIYPDPCFFHCFGSPKIQFLIISPCWRSQNLSNLVSEPVGGVVGGSTLEMCFCSKGRVSTIYLFRGGVIDHFYPFFIWSLKRCLRQAVFSLKLGNGRAFAWCIVISSTRFNKHLRMFENLVIISTKLLSCMLFYLREHHPNNDASSGWIG